jgi:hypothetical protein
MEENDISGICDMCGRRRMQIYIGVLEDLGWYWRLKIKWLLKKEYMRVCTGLIWPEWGKVGESFEHCIKHMFSIKFWEFPEYVMNVQLLTQD